MGVVPRQGGGCQPDTEDSDLKGTYGTFTSQFENADTDPAL